MNLEGNFNKENKLSNLRTLIKRAELNEDEEKVILLEAELRAIEKGEVFDREQFLAEQAAIKKAKDKFLHRKHNILRNMQSVPNADNWTYDGIEGINNYRYSYEYTFEKFLNNFGVDDFQELVDKRSKELKKKVKVLDLFGGAYFIPNLKNVSTITGVRLNNIDQKLLKQAEEDPETKEYLESLINNNKRNIIEGNLYKGSTWKEIEKKHASNGEGDFDLIVCRPEGPFRNAVDKTYSIEGVSDSGLSREEIFASLLEKTLRLLSRNGGMLFTQTPNLKTHPEIMKKFLEEYVEKKSAEGYEFMFQKEGTASDCFVVIRNSKLLKKNMQRGFIGILSLLIAVAVIALIFFRGSMKDKEAQTAEDKVENQTPIDLEIEAIDKAKKAKSTIESKYQNLEE